MARMFRSRSRDSDSNDAPTTPLPSDFSVPTQPQPTNFSQPLRPQSSINTLPTVIEGNTVPNNNSAAPTYTRTYVNTVHSPSVVVNISSRQPVTRPTVQQQAPPRPVAQPRTRSQQSVQAPTPAPRTSSRQALEPPANTGPRNYRVIRRELPEGRHTSVRIRRTPSSQSVTSVDDLQRQRTNALTPTPSRLGQQPPIPGSPETLTFDHAIARRPVGTEASPPRLRDVPVYGAVEDGRRRSLSEPSRPDPHTLAAADGHLPIAHSMTHDHMPVLAEERESAGTPWAHPDSAEPFPTLDETPTMAPPLEERPGMFRKASAAATRFFTGGGAPPNQEIRNRRKSNSVSSIGSRIRDHQDEKRRKQEEETFDSDLVDLLDVMDPEIATLSTLTNVQNSLFIPNLGPLLNRKATYNLGRPRGASRGASYATTAANMSRPGTATGYAPRRTVEEADELDRIAALERAETQQLDEINFRPSMPRLNTIDSTMTESRFAVLPHGQRLEGWTAAEKEELNDHVRHLLHSKREGFKRSMRGFGQYVRRPLGFFVTLYAVLITLFGAAWFFFLIGWISLGERKDYIINVVDNVLVALFAIMGDGLAPFRAVDTYHMIFIAHYHRLSWKLRKQQNMPKLEDKNDLPEKLKTQIKGDIDDLDDIEETAGMGQNGIPLSAKIKSNSSKKDFADEPNGRVESSSSNENDEEEGDPLNKEDTHRRSTMSNRSSMAGIDSRNQPADRDVNESYRRAHEYTVLTPQQQKKLIHHQQKFAKSHTFYKPHETATHHAFPLKLLITVVVLLDMHSCLQISLGACTWGIPYETRPFALTTVILCCSITVNIMGGVFISIGDHRTRKKDVIERMFRQELTGQAIEKLEKRRRKEAERNGDLAAVKGPGANSVDPLMENGRVEGKHMETLAEQTEDEELKQIRSGDSLEEDLGGVKQDVGKVRRRDRGESIGRDFEPKSPRRRATPSVIAAAAGSMI